MIIFKLIQRPTYLCTSHIQRIQPYYLSLNTIAKFWLYSAAPDIAHTADGIARFYPGQTNPVNSET